MNAERPLRVGDWVYAPTGSDDRYEIALVLGWFVRLIDGVRYSDPYLQFADGSRHWMTRCSLELAERVVMVPGTSPTKEAH